MPGLTKVTRRLFNVRRHTIAEYPVILSIRTHSMTIVVHFDIGWGAGWSIAEIQPLQEGQSQIL
jgi:hypothetical protein